MNDGSNTSGNVLSRFGASLAGWSRFLEALEAPRILEGGPKIRELRLRCLNLRRRLRDGPLAPPRIAFFGPTGAGKSKLFSSIIRQDVSGSGYQRPFTRKSCYYVHDRWHSLIAAMAGEVVTHHDDAWRDIVLVDTPDFDSVELANRDEAERIFFEADDFLFVTDALKYADASTWDYLSRIRRADKQFIVALNKVNSATIPSSFDARFRETFRIRSEQPLPYHTVVVPELPIGDNALIEDASIDQLRTQLRELVGKSPTEQSVDRLEAELDGVFERSADLLAEASMRQQQVIQMRQRLDSRYRESVDRLEYRLSEGLEPAVRNEVYQRVMLQLESIDLLRYPRKIIAYPIEGIRALWRSWSGGEKLADSVEHPQVPVDPVATETFHMLESELIRFADESRLDWNGQPGLEWLLDREQFKRLRLEHEEIQRLYTAQHAHFRSWVESHARDTAGQITGENKLKFILSQVLFNTVIITAQVKSFGGFSLLEAGLDGVVSPFIAKAISVAIGNEKVKQFESEAHAEHQRSLAAVIDQQRARFTTFLENASRGLGPLATQLQAIDAFRPSRDVIVTQFAAHGSPAADGDPHAGGVA